MIRLTELQPPEHTPSPPTDYALSLLKSTVSSRVNSILESVPLPKDAKANIKWFVYDQLTLPRPDAPIRHGEYYKIGQPWLRSQSIESSVRDSIETALGSMETTLGVLDDDGHNFVGLPQAGMPVRLDQWGEQRAYTWQALKAGVVNGEAVWMFRETRSVRLMLCVPETALEPGRVELGHFAGGYDFHSARQLWKVKQGDYPDEYKIVNLGTGTHLVREGSSAHTTVDESRLVGHPWYGYGDWVLIPEPVQHGSDRRTADQATPAAGSSTSVADLAQMRIGQTGEAERNPHPQPQALPPEAAKASNASTPRR